MTKTENLDRVCIVLVEPADGQNVGSVARAMKTQGITHLRIVPGERPVDPERVKQLSVHAFDIWENREEFDSLPQALSDCVLSIATTRRVGKLRKLKRLNPPQLVETLSTTGRGKVAIVFGRESTGLTDAEVGMCATVLTIPTSPDFPSLNLAQAVTIVCSTLYQGISDHPVLGQGVDHLRAENAADEITKCCDEAGFFKEASTEKQDSWTMIRDVILRSGMSEAELKRVEKFFDKASKIARFGKKPH